jgi:DinB family protein
MRTIWTRTTKLAAAAVCLAIAAQGQSLTPAEKERVQRDLVESREALVETVRGLTPEQWKFKPSPERWSAAEVVEHLALIEDLVSQGVLARMDKAPAGSADRDPKQVDAMILAKVPDRSTKYQAPPQAVPTGRWTPADTLEHFVAGRTHTIAVFNAMPDPRQHVIDHPVLGSLDAYEWVLAVAAHTERHRKQILELKADPNFPKDATF